MQDIAGINSIDSVITKLTLNITIKGLMDPFINGRYQCTGGPHRAPVQRDRERR